MLNDVDRASLVTVERIFDKTDFSTNLPGKITENIKFLFFNIVMLI
jgi:hypothetical protein